MQNLKLFAFAILGAGLLGINITTSTGCEASAEATGGSSGSGDAGSAGSGTAGTTAAGSGGSDAGSGGTEAAGSGGSAGAASDSSTTFAAALGADAACQTCLAGITGTVKDATQQDVDCTGVIAKCDGAQKCQDFIASVKGAKEQGTNTDPNCWVQDAAVAVADDTANVFSICATAACGDKCGNLNFATPTCN